MLVKNVKNIINKFTSPKRRGRKPKNSNENLERTNGEDSLDNSSNKTTKTYNLRSKNKTNGNQ